MAGRQNRDSTPGERVLIVDDEEGMCEMLSMVLTRHGFTTTACRSGAEALERMSAGDIEIVLSDVRMPEMSGIELLSRLTERQAPVIVIMMSAFGDLDVAVEALKLGAADYVSKPFKADEVLWKIRMAQERQRLEEERKRLQAENARLRDEVGQTEAGLAGIVGKSHRLLEIFNVVHKVADYKSTVLVLGESGTGKELVARALHEQSGRRGGPFVPINCGAIPETLLESELFGYVKGAFTDASRDHSGLVEEASGGTLFLDEIGELPLSLQVKLLRFLQEEEIRRVGASRSTKVDVRVVAATARDLGEMVKSGSFREDLYYRLNVLQIAVPPLRDRKDDIPLLVERFLVKYGLRLGRPAMSISRAALRILMDYHWPGNIRELENTIERAMVLSDSDRIEPESLPEKLGGEPQPAELPFFGEDAKLRDAVGAYEKEMIRRALEKTGGNRTHAAKLLDTPARTLLHKIKKYGLK